MMVAEPASFHLTSVLTSNPFIKANENHKKLQINRYKDEISEAKRRCNQIDSDIAVSLKVVFELSYKL